MLFLKCQIVLKGLKESVDLLKEHANISSISLSHICSLGRRLEGGRGGGGLGGW